MSPDPRRSPVAESVRLKVRDCASTHATSTSGTGDSPFANSERVAAFFSARCDRSVRGVRVAWLLGLTASLLFAVTCHKREPSAAAGKPGIGEGPDQYSARIVRTVEADGHKESFESRIAVSGQMIRQEWTENQEHRALIIRPDLGNAYVLFLDKGEFLVRGLGDEPGANSAPTMAQPPSQTAAAADSEPSLVDPVAIESDMSPASAPATLTNVALPDESVDHHPCKVAERRAVLSDGTTEVTRTYRATDLSGMIVRTESESVGKSGRLRVITERLDIQTEVPQTVFEIPAGFRRTSR